MPVSPESEAQNFVLVDLGSPFWVDTIRLLVSPFQPYGYRMQVCERTPDAEGGCPWTTVTPESQWETVWGSGAYEELPARGQVTSLTSACFTHHHVFAPSKARFLKLSCRYEITSEQLLGQKGLDLNILEWQIFGEGYVPEIVLTSGLIDVSSSHPVTGVDWDADTPPGTRIEVQTRTGDRLEEVKHYFNKDGEEVSAYWWHSKLPGFMKGPVEIGYAPGGPGWSPWSRVIEYADAPFESPAPCRYMQARVRLVSDDPHQCAVLRSLSFPFSEFLVKQITGRLSPEEVQRGGVPEVFSLRLHPVFRSSGLPISALIRY